MMSPGNGKDMLAGKSHPFQDGVTAMDLARLIDIWAREARMRSVLILRRQPVTLQHGTTIGARVTRDLVM